MDRKSFINYKVGKWLIGFGFDTQITRTASYLLRDNGMII